MQNQQVCDSPGKDQFKVPLKIAWLFNQSPNRKPVFQSCMSVCVWHFLLFYRLLIPWRIFFLSCLILALLYEQLYGYSVYSCLVGCTTQEKSKNATRFLHFLKISASPFSWHEKSNLAWSFDIEDVFVKKKKYVLHILNKFI